MFKLFKKFRPLDWVFILLIVALTVLQVWCTMQLTDEIANLMREITYIGYQKDPSLLGDTVYAFFKSCGSDWNALKERISAVPGLEPAMVETITNIADASMGKVWVHAGYFALYALSYTLTAMLISVIASAVTAHFATKIRSDINEKVSTFSLAEINRFSTASLITRATNDIEQIQMCILLMLRMVFAAPVTSIWAICKIQASSSELTLTTIVAILVLVVALSVIMILVLPKFKISQQIVDRLNGITREHITGIRVVHAYNAEEYQEEKFKKANDDLTKLNLFTSRAMGILNPVMTIVMDGVTVGILAVGAYVINQGKADYATISSFSTLAVQIVMSFMMLLMMFVLWPRASISAKRINELLATESSIQNPEKEATLSSEGEIEFKDVSFQYPDGEKPIISHLSFHANAGQTIAIIGATGCGKSSLVNLVSRLYDVTSGEVKIDGANIKDIKQKTLRSKIGFVPQKGVLFSGTVASNIGFGVDALSEEKMKKAADIACASSFIEEMPDKYNAPIAQGGTNVSGGQKQRICIARALAIDPEIMVFDDSFSALDFKTDLQVRENIKNSLPNVTKIIVAQRIGTIMDADEIIVLENGEVVGQGKHKDLLHACSTYRDIALSQLSKEELGL